jgi:hypothetical protein
VQKFDLNCNTNKTNYGKKFIAAQLMRRGGMFVTSRIKRIQIEIQLKEMLQRKWTRVKISYLYCVNEKCSVIGNYAGDIGH